MNLKSHSQDWFYSSRLTVIALRHTMDYNVSIALTNLD